MDYPLAALENTLKKVTHDSPNRGFFFQKTALRIMTLLEARDSFNTSENDDFGEGYNLQFRRDSADVAYDV
jgi:hypothetical protein